MLERAPRLWGKDVLRGVRSLGWMMIDCQTSSPGNPESSGPGRSFSVYPMEYNLSRMLLGGESAKKWVEGNDTYLASLLFWTSPIACSLSRLQSWCHLYMA